MLAMQVAGAGKLGRNLGLNLAGIQKHAEQG